jgi:hypothetical protein
MYGGYSISSYRRTAAVGERQVSADIVDDTKRFGRQAYLASVRIDQTKGKAFDANLHPKRRYGNLNFAGPVGGGDPAGGTAGRQSAIGTRAVVTIPRGMLHRIHFRPQIINAPV